MSIITGHWDDPVRVALPTGTYASNRYCAIRIDLTHPLDEDTPTATPDPAKFPTQATGPTTGGIGPDTATLLWRNPDLEVADSDIPGIHALVLDGEMVGFATKAADEHTRQNATPDSLPRLFLVADALLGFLDHDEAILAAGNVLYALDNQPEGADQ